MRLRHSLLGLLAVLCAAWLVQAQLSAQQDIAADIVQAENFYYQARFDEALTLLSSVDQKLAKETNRAPDQAKVKLLIGLCQLALDEAEQARAHFLEFCVLDPQHSLDEKLFPPKVVSIVKEMDADCSRCVRVCSEAQSLLAAGNLEGAADLQSREPSCPCAWGVAASDGTRLRAARELLDQKKYPEALKEFQALLSIDPSNAALRDTVTKIQQQLDSAVLAAISDWREQFASRLFERAAVTYEVVRSLEAQGSAETKDAVLKIRQQYEKTFQDLIRSWNSACARNDEVALNTIRAWSRDLDPNRTIQPEALDHMRECAGAPSANGRPATSGGPK